MTQKLRLDLPVLLPDVPDAADACVERLEGVLARHPGVTEVHVVEEEGSGHSLCLHYDADTVTLAQMERLARSAGAELTERYGHAVLPIRAIDAEDAARRIEQSLLGIDGVLAASVSLPAQRARVEFDRQRTSLEALRTELGRMGYASAPPAAHQAGCCHPREAVPDDAGWYAANKELTWSLVGGLLLAAAWAGQRWLGLPREGAIALYAASYAFGAWDLTRHWGGCRSTSTC
jgi:Cd2+/Zn2+-exporting ATPase